MATQTLAAPSPSASCRTDWATWTFKTPKAKQIEENLEYFYRLGEHLLPNGEWSPPHSGRHFTHILKHDSGMSCEFTPEGKGQRNQGLMAINLPGQVWGAMEALERLIVIADVGELAGYYRCTRWDAQLTTLSAPITAEQFVQRANEKSLWAVRYGQGMAYGRQNLHNDWIIPPSYYFGARGSNAMARVYDHGAKWRWPVPSLRFELELRKQWANDHFSRLQRTANQELENEAGDLYAEEISVKSALKQHLRLKDTSKWVGKRLPKNWAQTAPDLDWYEELLDKTHDTLKATHKPVATWERAQELAIEQYGRKCAKQMIVDCAKRGMPFHEVASIFAARMAATMQPEDLLDLKEVIPEEQWETLRNNFHDLTGEIAEMVDELQLAKKGNPPRG